MFEFRRKLETVVDFVRHLFCDAERDICRFFQENFLYLIVDILSNFVGFLERVSSGLVPRDLDVNITGKIG
jgi:hypothetical protein